MNNTLDTKINSFKEVLSSMPQNNKKNKEKYLKYIESLEEAYNQGKDLILEEIKERKNKILDKLSSYQKKETLSYSEELNKLSILNKYNTPYEKIGLDKLLLDIDHFYKDDFDSLNEDIKKVLDIFKLVKVNLTSKDFLYSPYSYKYINLYIEELQKENISVEELRKCFEELYWKCPNIVFHIELNFKYLYQKYEKNFIKYYQNIEKEILINENKESIYNRYKEKYINNYFEDKNDMQKIKDNFINGTYNIKDYEKEKIEQNKKSLSDEEISNEDLIKLYNSLAEYKGYLEHEFLINSFKKLYSEKTKYKNAYKLKLKEIKKKQGTCIKLTKKISLSKRLKDNKKEVLLIKLNTTLDELKKLYDELELSKFYEKVETLDDSITYSDILLLIKSYYIYERKAFLEEYKDLSDKELKDKVNLLEDFLNNPNKTLINNITVNDNFDIALIISDRYKLSNIKLSKEDVETNRENITNTIDKIMTYKTVEESSITIEDLSFLCRIEKIVE